MRYAEGANGVGGRGPPPRGLAEGQAWVVQLVEFLLGSPRFDLFGVGRLCLVRRGEPGFGSVAECFEPAVEVVRPRCP